MACATLKRSYDFDPLVSPSQLQRSPKRRRCGPLVVSSPVQTTKQAKLSPFVEKTPKFSSDELSASVLEEWKKMKKQQKLSSSLSSPSQNDQTDQHKSFIFQSSPSNFSMPPLGNCLNGYLPPNLHATDGSSKSGKEQPMFTAKQVVMVCERLWKEREEKLREEYDQVLHERLSEQYNAFLRFTQDQIMRQYREQTCSYVS